MSYANGTTNYNLPQTVGTDKRDWSDTNQAFYDVDAALKSAADAASQASEDITSLTTRVGNAEDDIVNLKAEDISLDGRLDTAEGAISTLQLQVPDVRSDLEDMITAFNEATATSTHAYSEGDYFIYNDVLYKATTSIGIGDTIVPNTNCSATNVMTEIGSGAAAPTAADVSLAPITGMTADDVQEGIEELNTALSDKADVKSTISVTGDGVKTLNTLLAELKAAFVASGKSLKFDSYIVDGYGQVYRMAILTNTSVQFQNTSFNPATEEYYFRPLDFTNSVMYYGYCKNPSTVAQIVDNGTGVYEDGASITLYI